MKKPTVVSRWLPVLALGALAAPAALAVNVTANEPVCESGTFLAYSSGACEVGGLLSLLNFNLYSINTANQQRTVEPNSFLSTISVDPGFTNGTLTLGIGGFPSVAANQTAEYELDYTIDPPPVVDDMTAGFDPPFGNINGTVVFCGDPLVGTAAAGCSVVGSFGFGVTNGVPFAGSSGPFAHPVSTLVTQTFFTLNPGGNTASGFDSLIFTVGTTAATPEPGAWLLAASALGFLAFRRKLRRG